VRAVDTLAVVRKPVAYLMAVIAGRRIFWCSTDLRPVFI